MRSSRTPPPPPPPPPPSSSSSLLLQLPRRCFDQHRRSLSVRCTHYHRLFPLVLPLILLRPSVLAAQRVDDRDLTLCDAEEVRVRCRPKLINHRAQRAAARSLQELRWVARLDDPPLSKDENLIGILQETISPFFSAFPINVFVPSLSR